VFAAGYDISEKAGWKRMMSEMDSTVGIARLKALHLNDSRKPCGSRVDRHAHIGHGEIGKAAFERVMRDRRLARVPKVIETPKENDMDAVNLALLRKLAGKK
jgi:deoxyribonuclease-4